MTDRQKEILRAVLRTLDSIQVSGVQNLDRLLGCLKALNAVLETPNASTDKEEP